MNNERQTERREAARRRFGRLMVVMVVVTALVLVVAFTWLVQTGTPLPVHLVVAVSLAVIGSLMLAAALMGLVFFSNASGADEEQQSTDSVERP
jgi:uncharacterized protein (DUF983 family)